MKSLKYPISLTTYIFIFFIAFFLNSNCAKATSISTLQICDSLLNPSKMQISNYLTSNNLATYSTLVSPAQYSNYLLSMLAKDNNSLQIQDSLHIVYFKDVQIECKYDLLGKDSLIRNISIKGEILFLNKADINKQNSIKIASIDNKFQDSIARSEVSLLENPHFPFTQSKVPNAPTSFWEEYLEPAIITVSAAATVLLFFTVRSE